MKTNAIYFLFLLLAAFSCKEETLTDSKPSPEPGYPTTYKELSFSEWNVRNDAFQQINNQDKLFINKFGFLEGKAKLNSNFPESADEFISGLDSFIHKYHDFMGIKDVGQVKISEKTSYGSIVQKEDFISFLDYLYSENKTYSFSIHLSQDELDWSQCQFDYYPADDSIRIIGNWFPDYVIPSQDIYTADEALKVLRIWNQEKGHNYDFSKGNYFAFRHLGVWPLVANSSFKYGYEIREYWTVIAKDSSYWLFVDTQTGKILSL